MFDYDYLENDANGSTRELLSAALMIAEKAYRDSGNVEAADRLLSIANDIDNAESLILSSSFESLFMRRFDMPPLCDECRSIGRFHCNEHGARLRARA